MIPGIFPYQVLFHSPVHTSISLYKLLYATQAYGLCVVSIGQGRKKKIVNEHTIFMINTENKRNT